MTGVLLWAADISAVRVCVHLTSCAGLPEGNLLLLPLLVVVVSNCKLKEEALDRTVWRTGFGRGCGPVERQTTG